MMSVGRLDLAMASTSALVACPRLTHVRSAPAVPSRFLLNARNWALVLAVKASGSYSSLDRWVFQGDRLAPQVIHSPLTADVSTLWYLTRVSLPVAGSWSSVSTPIGDGRR